ncbi:hypothetical protein pb186bvf_010348 [Paramecium bursaria]
MLFFILTLVTSLPTQDQVNYTAFQIPYSGLWYSGYLDIEPEKAFHYFFFPHSNPQQYPLILWLNGGPGCSSLTGALIENGPFVFQTDCDKFISNQWSWTKFASMLYIETPAMVGFSYGSDISSDASSAKENLIAVLEFLRKFSELKDLDLYIAGESYAGIYIPNLVNEILDYNEQNPTKRINIKGMMIGNGCTDPTECTVEAAYYPFHKFQFFKNHNFISNDLWDEILTYKDYCWGRNEPKCQELKEEVYRQVNFDDSLTYNPYNIYGRCFDPPLDGQKLSQQDKRDFFNDPFGRGHVSPCADAKGQYKWLIHSPEFLKAINISPKSDEWARCTSLKYTKDKRGTYYLYPKIIKNNIKVLKFSGDIDGVVPITGSLYWIDKLQREFGLPTIVPWRPWYKSGTNDQTRQNAGSYWQIQGLTFVSIRNAGHMVPQDQREAAYILIKSFIDGVELPAQ